MNSHKENEMLLITFQPLRACETLKDSIKSDNNYLYEYKELLGYNPIFCNSLEGQPIEYIITDILLSYPRNPEIAIIFKKDKSKIDTLSRLQVFQFDNSLDNTTKEDQEGSLKWENKVIQNNTLEVNYSQEGLKDYLVENITLDEIQGIYMVTEDKNAILYDNLYRYEHLEYIQWVIESLIVTTKGFNPAIDVNKIPKVDTNTEEFMENLQLIYNQLVYRPNNITEYDLMKFENIIEKMLFDTVNPISENKRAVLANQDSIYNTVIDKNYIKENIEYQGNHIETFSEDIFNFSY